jgi:hypothetical protein
MQYSFSKSALGCSSVVSLKEEKRKKKEGSGDSSVYVYLRLRAPHPLCNVLCLFFLLLLFIQFGFFFSFSLGGGQSVQGAMLIWTRVVCGSTMCHLAHLVVCFSRASRSWCVVAREPSWFLRLMWSGDAMRGLGVWRSRGFASSPWFFL